MKCHFSRSKSKKRDLSDGSLEWKNVFKVWTNLMQENICMCSHQQVKSWTLGRFWPREQPVWQNTEDSKEGSDPSERSEMKRQLTLRVPRSRFSELEHENTFPITLKFFPSLNQELPWLYCPCSAFFMATLLLQSSLKKNYTAMSSSQNHHLHGFCPALCSARKLPHSGVWPDR